MIRWLKKNEKVKPEKQQVLEEETNHSLEKVSTKTGGFSWLRQGLSKTRQELYGGMMRLLRGKNVLDQEVLENLEMLLLQADVGVRLTEHLLTLVKKRWEKDHALDGDAAYSLLKKALYDILAPIEVPWSYQTKDGLPFVILMVGVNGAGKTTTIGKLAHYFKKQGLSVMLAAGDTFRAAAVEQLQAWGEKNAVPVIAQHAGADSASVIFDAYASAKAKKIDILLADTAGRLHTQGHLMEELKKIKRVLAKQSVDLPHEILLVLDGGTGQNALHQAREFHEMMGVSGMVMTKLDGTAKGGIIFAIAEELSLPLRFIGLGESLEDLEPFEANSFINALFSHD